MTPRLRIWVLLALAALAFGLVACGGDGEGASADDDVNDLLEQTFDGDQQIDSGKLDIKVQIEAQGGEASGPVSVSLKGPFVNNDDGELPEFDLDLSFEGAGQSLTAGATSTGDKGFLNFNGTDYAVSEKIFADFKKGYEDAQADAEEADQQSLADFGLDPRSWLTNPKNEGEAKVGDDDAIKITGGVDTAKLVENVEAALPKLREQAQGAAEDFPTKFTDEQKRQFTEAVKDVKVEIYTGKDDSILRRMLLNLTVTPPAEAGVDVQNATIAFDMSFTDVNEDQEISAPEDAKPLDELLGQLGGLGLGGLGGTGGAGGAGSSGSGSAGGASTEALEAYSECVREADGDAAKTQECAGLLTP